MSNKKSAVVAIIGRPNAGKSTLLNKILGQKIAIVTHKAQTTRTVMRGISTIDETQIVFLDTPGIFSAKRDFERNMVRAAWSSVVGADFVILMIDGNVKHPVDEEVYGIIKRLKQQNLQVIFVVNKADKIHNKHTFIIENNLQDICDSNRTIEKVVGGEKGPGEHTENVLEDLNTADTTLLPLAVDLRSMPIDLFFISALHNEGVNELCKYIVDRSAYGPWLYAEDEITTAPMRFIACEITREKILLNLHEEIPYNINVDTESWDVFDNGSVKIHQIIYVRTKSHKQIVLGKHGSMIKKISSDARVEINDTLDMVCHLYLFVKIRDNWMEKVDLQQFLPH